MGRETESSPTLTLLISCASTATTSVLRCLPSWPLRGEIWVLGKKAREVAREGPDAWDEFTDVYMFYPAVQLDEAFAHTRDDDADRNCRVLV